MRVLLKKPSKKSFCELGSLALQNNVLTPSSHFKANASYEQVRGQRDLSHISELQISVAKPTRQEFWLEKAQHISWFRSPELPVLSNLEDDFVKPKWFSGGWVNACYNCVDRHVESGQGDQFAIIHDSPVTKTISRISFHILLKKVKQLAYRLQKMGVGKGDRVLIYMPMIPEAMVTMLACARIGAVHSLVFGGFASRELANRISHAKPKVVVAASYGLEPNRNINYKLLLDKALQMCTHPVENCIIYQRPQLDPVELDSSVYVDWAECVDGVSEAQYQSVDCVPLDAMDPLYLLYTSGTTGKPKAIVRPVGGHLVMLQYTMDAVFDVKPGETYFAGSDLGWVVGHSYICYAPLVNRNTTILYEGKPTGTPDCRAYYRLIASHKPSCVFTAPTALRAIRREDEDLRVARKYNIPKAFKKMFVAGEHLDAETQAWARKAFRRPIIDHFWQTESGSPILAVLTGRSMDPAPVGSAGKAVPGFDVRILNEEGKHVNSGEMGNIVIKTPLPPGFTDGLYLDEDDHAYRDKYFSKFRGFYDTHDTGFTDINGYISVMSRTDDVINVAGKRISTSALEEAILRHPGVTECAVIPVPDDLKGSVPLGVLVIKEKFDWADLSKEIVDIVREDVGPVAAFNKAVQVPKLPKTRSGKISRGSMTSLAADKAFSIPATIEDASAYDDLQKALQRVGFARNPNITNKSDFL